MVKAEVDLFETLSRWCLNEIALCVVCSNERTEENQFNTVYFLDITFYANHWWKIVGKCSTIILSHDFGVTTVLY